MQRWRLSDRSKLFVARLHYGRKYLIMTVKIDKQAVIKELQRVSQLLDKKRVGYRDFEKLSSISRSTVVARFGTWNNALEVAGLLPATSRRHDVIPDEDLLVDIIVVAQKLRKIPTQTDMLAHGKYSDSPYKTRWGTFTNARKISFEKYGVPSEVDALPARKNSTRNSKKQLSHTHVSVGAANNLKPHLLKIDNLDTRNFVEEAINCLEMDLYRSAVVMSWIGAVSVLYDYVLANKIRDFNTEAKRRNPKWKIAKTKDDLALMREAEFLDILSHLSILSKNVKEQLKNNCLGLRNACGHPNSFKLGRNMVESHLETLILNVYEVF